MATPNVFDLLDSLTPPPPPLVYVKTLGEAIAAILAAVDGMSFAQARLAISTSLDVVAAQAPVEETVWPDNSQDALATGIFR